MIRFKTESPVLALAFLHLRVELIPNRSYRMVTKPRGVLTDLTFIFQTTRVQNDKKFFILLLDLDLTKFFFKLFYKIYEKSEYGRVGLNKLDNKLECSFRVKTERLACGHD